jgi:hypothetical protein
MVLRKILLMTVQDLPVCMICNNVDTSVPKFFSLGRSDVGALNPVNLSNSLEEGLLHWNGGTTFL